MNLYNSTQLKNLRVGVLYETELAETAPSVKNCLLEVVEKLKSVGVTVEVSFLDLSLGIQMQRNR